MEERDRRAQQQHHHMSYANQADAAPGASLPPVMHAPATAAAQNHSPYNYQTSTPRPIAHQQTPAPQQTQYATQDYRVPSNGISSVSLPPIHHFEPAPASIPSHHNHQPPLQPAQQPHRPPLQPQYSNGDVQYAQHYAPIPQPPYHYHNGTVPTMPSNMVNGHIGYNMNPHVPVDSRPMSGGRNRKEIKRRTKTGCLTCRKRRIKCDERHPSCKNCEKSKRECLGYDPIFKQNPGPPTIQPAPPHQQMPGVMMKQEHALMPTSYPTPYDGADMGYGAPRPHPPPHLPSNGSSSDSMTPHGAPQMGEMKMAPKLVNGGHQYQDMMQPGRRGG